MGTSYRLKLIESDIIKLYLDKKSTKYISTLFKINIKTVRNILRRNNIDIRKCKQNLLGTVFGKLTVIKFTKYDNNKKPMWLCKCDCGNEKEIRAGDLNSKKIKSCGCLYKETSPINIKKAHLKYPKTFGYKGIYDLPGKLISQIKNGAMKRGLEYSITKEYLWDLFIKQNKKCALSGIDIKFKPFKRAPANEGNASLDRIDNTKGYIIGNVQWVHKDINNMKQIYTQNQFIEWCKKVANHNK